MIALWLAGAARASEPLLDEALGESPLVEVPAVAAPAKPVPDLLAEDPPDRARKAADPDWMRAIPAGPDVTGLWPFGLAAIGAGLVILARRKKTARPADLTVISRTSVSSHSALLLVDVRDPLGREHRILVGTGGGPPTLVADLGIADDVDEDEVDDLPRAYAGRTLSANVRRPTHAQNELLEMPTLPNLFDPQPGARRKAAAQALISEIVEERRTAMVR